MPLPRRRVGGWRFDYSEQFTQQYSSLPETDQNKIMRRVLNIVESPNPHQLESTEDLHPVNYILDFPPQVVPFPDIGYEIEYEVRGSGRAEKPQVWFISLNRLGPANHNNNHHG